MQSARKVDLWSALQLTVLLRLLFVRFVNQIHPDAVAVLCLFVAKWHFRWLFVLRPVHRHL